MRTCLILSGSYLVSVVVVLPITFDNIWHCGR